MPVRKISQKDVAARAGVHVTTVSMALRNSTRLPEATRQRIRALAEEMGYQPDPMLSALTVYRRNTLRPHYQGTLAWLNTIKPGTPQYGSGFADYRAGAEARCTELGYKLEEFRTAETPLPRLSRILQARNITGLLLPPQPRRLSHINFDWENYSAVSFGFSLARPRLHLIANAQYRSARIAVRAMRSCGYRRIGFASLQNSEIRTDQNFSSGYLAEQRFERRDHPPLFIFDDSTPAGRKTFLPSFSQWYSTHRPDAILALDDDIPGALKKLEIAPEVCGFASLSLLPNFNPGSVAGIDQNGPIIGRTAVDILIDMIHRNERDIPRIPLRILVEGTWRDGASLPRSLRRESERARAALL